MQKSAYFEEVKKTNQNNNNIIYDLKISSNFLKYSLYLMMKLDFSNNVKS